MTLAELVRITGSEYTEFRVIGKDTVWNWADDNGSLGVRVSKLVRDKRGTRDMVRHLPETTLVEFV